MKVFLSKQPKSKTPKLEEALYTLLCTQNSNLIHFNGPFVQSLAKRQLRQAKNPLSDDEKIAMNFQRDRSADSRLFFVSNSALFKAKPGAPLLPLCGLFCHVYDKIFPTSWQRTLGMLRNMDCFTGSPQVFLRVLRHTVE